MKDQVKLGPTSLLEATKTPKILIAFLKRATPVLYLLDFITDLFQWNDVILTVNGILVFTLFCFYPRVGICCAIGCFLFWLQFKERKREKSGIAIGLHDDDTSWKIRRLNQLMVNYSEFYDFIETLDFTCEFIDVESFSLLKFLLDIISCLIDRKYAKLGLCLVPVVILILSISLRIQILVTGLFLFLVKHLVPFTKATINLTTSDEDCTFESTTLTSEELNLLPDQSVWIYVLERERFWIGIGWQKHFLPFKSEDGIKGFTCLNFKDDNNKSYSFENIDDLEGFVESQFSNNDVRWLTNSWVHSDFIFDNVPYVTDKNGWVYCDNKWNGFKSSAGINTYTRMRIIKRKFTTVFKKTKEI